jgi:RNA polymerase sigma-70 factor (ECF subfamily)
MGLGFETVYQAHGRRVHDYLVRLTGDRWLAEELCQETFLRFLRRPPRLHDNNGAVSVWLYRVATNLARDRARRRASVSLRDEPIAPEGQAAIEARDLDARIREEVERLPEDLRAAFLLRAHHELSFPHAARVLEVSERTAKERFRRAREILAHRLAPLIREDER